MVELFTAPERRKREWWDKNEVGRAQPPSTLVTTELEDLAVSSDEEVDPEPKSKDHDKTSLSHSELAIDDDTDSSGKEADETSGSSRTIGKEADDTSGSSRTSQSEVCTIPSNMRKNNLLNHGLFVRDQYPVGP